jgi:hypothetical protein
MSDFCLNSECCDRLFDMWLLRCWCRSPCALFYDMLDFFPTFEMSFVSCCELEQMNSSGLSFPLFLV